MRNYLQSSANDNNNHDADDDDDNNNKSFFNLFSHKFTFFNGYIYIYIEIKLLFLIRKSLLIFLLC